jgi:hypothetical protein
MRFVLMIVCAALGALFAGASAFAEKRVALVIGNSTYRSAPTLPNPKNDAEDVAAALRRIGFDPIVGFDLDRAGMEDATIKFARAARDSDVALFYYAGHAMQFGGVNYLLPIDVKLSDEADLRRMTRVDDIVEDLKLAKSLRILILDSCRDNPLTEEFKRSVGTTRSTSMQRGLARIDKVEGTIVSFATQPGRTADDGRGRNSPYTAAFLRHIETPEEIGTIFRNISEDVYQVTNRQQLPELSLSIIGKFYLKGQMTITVTPPAPPPPTPLAVDPAERAWAVTQNTTSIAVLEDFIRQFGNTPYGSMARARLEELRKSQVAVIPPSASVSPNPSSPPAAPTPTGCRTLAGVWTRSVSGLSQQATFLANGTGSNSAGHTFRWRCVGGNDYVINWDDGDRSTLILSADGRRMSEKWDLVTATYVKIR